VRVSTTFFLFTVAEGFVFIAKGGFTAPYQTTCFGAGYTGLNNPPLSYDELPHALARPNPAGNRSGK